jgi:PAS domain S-box-containing protein
MDDQHEEIIREVAEQFAPILENSPDGVYLWLDEDHMVCNERFAQMFGATAAEWNARPPYFEDIIVEDDMSMYAWNFQNRVARLLVPAAFRFRGKRKDGTTFDAETDMIPVTLKGHVLAYHFVRRVDG